MTPTLRPGQEIRLLHVDVTLDVLPPGEPKCRLNEVRSVIRNGGVYLLAINDMFDRQEYTLKRVTYHEDDRRDWFMLISADNPGACWGNEGRWLVRRSDRVHFAGEWVELAL